MAELNLDVARLNMVENQIRTWDVLDARVLELIARAPRADFVPERFRNIAYSDMNIPLAHGQVMMAPKVEARLLQALDIRPGDRVLEVGTGSGYVTWLLSQLANSVISVEIHRELSAMAERTLARHGADNVTLEVGDGARGWDMHGPYDAIFVTGSLPILPEAFQKSLAVDGRLAVIVGLAPAMEAKLIRRLAAGSFAETSLFETVIPALENAPQPDRFVF